MIKDVRIYELIDIMKKNGYTKTEMAGLCGISYITWNRWVKGECTPINKNTIERIEQVIVKNK